MSRAIQDVSSWVVEANHPRGARAIVALACGHTWEIPFKDGFPPTPTATRRCPDCERKSYAN